MNPSPQRSKADRPRFRQIVDLLRREIVDGGMAEHAPLPSERVIAETHGVSRMTARRALEAIEAEGLAYSADRRGRFVSPRRLTYDISGMVSLAADAEARGVDLEIELIEAGTIAADAILASRLAVPRGEPLHRYTRRFRTDGHAIFVETEYVIARRCPDLLRHDLRQPTTKLWERQYDVLAESGDISIRMRAMRAEEAALLGLAPSHAGIQLEQVIRDDRGTAFCLGQQIWRGELAEFTARAIVNPVR